MPYSEGFSAFERNLFQALNRNLTLARLFISVRNSFLLVVVIYYLLKIWWEAKAWKFIDYIAFPQTWYEGSISRVHLHTSQSIRRSLYSCTIGNRPIPTWLLLIFAFLLGKS